MVKKKKIFLIFIAVCFVCIIAMGIRYKSIVNRPLKNDEETVEIVIDDGDGFNTLLEKLENEGKLRDKLVLKINNKINKRVVNLIPGTYEVDTNSSFVSLLEELESEDFNKGEITITIPEGYNIDKMAEYFEENKIISKNEFIEAVKNYKVPDYVKADENKKYNLEGYLYPDTYFLNEGFTANDLIETMLLRFREVISDIETKKGIKISDTDMETIITKASLVEKEVRVEEERPKVASVIENRLKKGMKLEFCSTINYVIGYEKTTLYNSDLTVESPYNTYKYYGLPVGPISSPGEASIEAVLSPSNTEYLFFVLTEDEKTHHFSTTLEEHEKAKKEAEEKRK